MQVTDSPNIPSGMPADINRQMGNVNSDGSGRSVSVLDPIVSVPQVMIDPDPPDPEDQSPLQGETGINKINTDPLKPIPLPFTGMY